MPTRLKTLLENSNVERITIGCSDSDVFFINDLDCYLKVVSNNSKVNLKLEKEKLEWLDGKFSVPKIVKFEIFENKSYLLIKNLEGQNSTLYYSQKQNSLELLKSLPKI